MDNILLSSNVCTKRRTYMQNKASLSIKRTLVNRINSLGQMLRKITNPISNTDCDISRQAVQDI